MFYKILKSIISQKAGRLAALMLIASLAAGNCVPEETNADEETASYSVGGSVSGLIGTVVLTNNDSNDLTVTEAESFAFTTPFPDGAEYNVQVKTQPIGQTCTPGNNAGSISGSNITDITITCSSLSYSIGVSVAGLSGILTLQNNSGDDMQISIDGDFTFDTPVAYGANYLVTALTQPAGEYCHVFNGLGTITSAVTNIIVQCPDLLGGSLQGFDIGVTGLVTTVVGYGSGADGIGQEARISPNQMVSDGVNLYIADNNYTIRKVVLATGEVTTIAGKHQDYRTVDGIGTDARFTRPFAITLVDGNLYIAQDSDEIRKMNLATGMVTTMTLSSSDGSSLAYPMGLASDGIHLFVSNQNQTNILKIVIGTGDMSAIAGPLTQTCALTDGIGPAARFCSTGGMALNGGQLYIADQGNNAIRILNISTGEVTTLAGQLDRSAGSTDGTGTSASFNNPSGVAADGSYLYVTDSLNYTVRKITLAGAQVTTIAGTVGNRRAANGTGLSARFGSLSLGILIMNENLYVSDSGAIRKIETATANVTTFAGVLEGQDGLGKTVDIKPWTITSDGRYVYSSAGSEIRKLDTLTGEVITLAGNVFNWGYVDGAGADAQFDGMSMTTDGSYIYVSDWNNCNIRKVDSVTGFTSTLAGRDSNDCTHADGIGNAAGFETLSDRGLTINGNMLYVPDTNLGNPTLRQINTQNGEVTTITLAGEPITPMKLTTDGVYFYFSENSGSAIYRGTLNAGTMTISLLAGDPNTRDRVDSSFLDARFNEVGAMTTDGTSLYFADIDGGILPRIIRKMNLTTGMVTTIAGGGVFDGFSPVYGFADGFGSEARFSSYIADITTDGLHLYVADNENGIRRIE